MAFPLTDPTRELGFLMSPLVRDQTVPALELPVTNVAPYGKNKNIQTDRI